MNITPVFNQVLASHNAQTVQPHVFRVENLDEFLKEAYRIVGHVTRHGHRGLLTTTTANTHYEASHGSQVDTTKLPFYCATATEKAVCAHQQRLDDHRQGLQVPDRCATQRNRRPGEAVTARAEPRDQRLAGSRGDTADHRVSSCYTKARKARVGRTGTMGSRRRNNGEEPRRGARGGQGEHDQGTQREHHLDAAECAGAVRLVPEFDDGNTAYEGGREEQKRALQDKGDHAVE